MTRCSIVRVTACASLHPPSWTRLRKLSRRRERWHTPLPSSGFVVSRRVFGTLSCQSQRTFSPRIWSAGRHWWACLHRREWRHRDQGSTSPPMWLRRGLGPGERRHSRHAGCQSMHFARKNSIRGQGGTPSSGCRPPAVRESYTASYHVRLRVCDQRICPRKT